MIVRSLLIAATFFLLALAPLSAAEPEEGILQGQLANGTEGGGSVTDQTVTLKIYLNDAEASSTDATTDSEGVFEFHGLSTDPSYSYEVSVNYQGADYFSGRVSFEEGETSTFIGLMVYDSTTSDEVIKVVASHVVIYVQEGSLYVVEFAEFLNEGDQTYIGSREVSPDGRKETLKFSLPQEATQLQLSQGLMECCILQTEGGFVDTMAVLPLEKQVSFSYRIEYSPPQHSFTLVTDYPTDVLQVLVHGQGIQASSDELVSQGYISWEDSEYLYFLGEDIGQGSHLTITLWGLPGGGDIQGLFKWAAPGLVALVVGLALGYSLIRKKHPPLQNHEQRANALLVELARLDDEFEMGKSNRKSYWKLRAEKKAQLIKLRRGAKGRSFSISPSRDDLEQKGEKG